MNIIIYDFEIFKFNTLLGVIILQADKETLYQTWNEDEIRKFYQDHKDDMWIGHNNQAYDDLILETIVNKKSAFNQSKMLINSSNKPFCKLHLYSYDLMNTSTIPFSLKLTELICGNNIHTTDVDFDINRPLTEEEKKLEENYNQDDLKQTLYNFHKFYNQFKLRLDIISEFNLDMMHNLKCGGTTLASNVLNIKKDKTLPYKPIKPQLYANLQLKNEELKNFYLNEEYNKVQGKKIVICGATISFGKGGTHSAIPKYHTDKVLYFDVSGYYNLLTINYDLFPRSFTPQAKEQYKQMYHDQLKLKKTNPIKRMVYKKVLLSITGGMNYPNCAFYDPYQYVLVTLGGQLFIADLLEKLEGLIKVIQTNTDGIMVEPYDWNDESKIISIVEEWEKRTGFNIKKEHIYNLWQRDVNCYCCLDENNQVEYKGGMLKNYNIDDKAYSSADIFDCKEPPIIAKGIVDFLLFSKTPEETIEELKDNLKYFQYSCKKGTYNYLTLDTIKNYVNPFGRVESENIASEKIQPLDRAFASKIEYLDENTYLTKLVVKHKASSQAKIGCMPTSVFICNDDINDEKIKEQVKNKINYQWYIDKIYEHLEEFNPN